jgi:hypothetical protein
MQSVDGKLDLQSSMLSSPLTRSEDEFESTHLLREVSTPELEKHRAVFEYFDDGQLGDHGIRSLKANHGYHGAWRSKSRYIAFAILSFVCVSYYFWTILFGVL